MNRYDSSKNKDSDSNECLQYNQTFSTFGPENDMNSESK